MRILVAEDDESAGQSLKGFFAGKGHQVSWCKTGRQALEAMHAQRFDLVILDMVLEGVMTGWDVAYIKHVDPELTGVPLVLMTAERGGDDPVGGHVRAVATRAAMTIISKPLDFRMLEKALLEVSAEPVTKVHGRGVLPDKDRGGSHG
jgi:DNA-binding response OmpR family regulator